MKQPSPDITKYWPWTLVPTIGAILIVAFYRLPEGSVEASAVYDLIGLFAVAAAVVGINHYRPAGWKPWLFVAAGQLAFVIGDILWTIYSAQGEDPFPSTADSRTCSATLLSRSGCSWRSGCACRAETVLGSLTLRS